MSHAPEIRTKPPCRREDALLVLRRLRDAGHTAFFAGGCVRDSLLGLSPKDWDVATDAPPNRVRALFPRTQAVGQAFGVILVRQGASQVEVATFRTDGKYLDGRRPSEVHFTTAEEDARRRDFTINGLFLDPLDNDRVIDFVGGLDDLHHRLLRAIGDPAARFREDHLRLLRAVRFAARFSFEIEPATAQAIAADAPLLKGISPERIADELRLMLTAPTRTVAWPLLWRFRLIDVIFRFLPATPPAVFDHARCPLIALRPGQPIPFGLALAAGALCFQAQAAAPADFRPLLRHDAVHRAVRAMRQALRIANDESDLMAGALEGAGLLLTDTPPRIALLKRFLARPSADASRALLDALWAIGQHRPLIEDLANRLAELETSPFAPPPLITGDDLTAAGLQPGPLFKRILDQVYDAQLEDQITTRDHALRLALELSTRA